MKDPMKDHILGTMFVTAGPAGDSEKTVRRRILGLDAVIHMSYPTMDDLNGSYIITKDFLKDHDISIEEAWKAALFPRKYSFALRGVSAREAHVLPEYASDIFILIQRGIYTGNAAIVLLFPEILEGICRKISVESLVLIPVTSESMLLYKGAYGHTELFCMLDTLQAGRDKVRPEMRLPQTIYRFDCRDRRITYLAARFAIRDVLPFAADK